MLNTLFGRTRSLAFVLVAMTALIGCLNTSIEPAVPVPAPTEEPKKEYGLWAGVDIGSKGLKPIILTFVQTSGSWDFQAQTDIKSVNIDLGTPGDDGGLDPARIKAAAEALANLDKAFRDHKVPVERVRMVVSSGVFTRVKEKERASSKAKLTAAIEAAVGRPPSYIDDREEAALAARAIIGPSGRTGRMVIDIGSGNTKFGWYSDKGFENATLDTGTKALRDEATKHATDKKTTFAEALAELGESVVAATLHKKLAGTAIADKLADVQVIGGAAWALSTYTHPGTSKQMRVPLSPADLERFTELAKLKPEEALEAIVKPIADPELRAQAVEEVKAVQVVFKPQDLQAGAEILRAAFKELKLDAPGKKVVFFQKGQYAWIAGYLMTEAKLPE